MAVYVMLTNLTDEGRKTLKNNPERINEVNKEVEEMGGKILAQYAILGPYDFINIIGTVGNTTITKIALERPICYGDRMAVMHSAGPAWIGFWPKVVANIRAPILL